MGCDSGGCMVGEDLNKPNKKKKFKGTTLLCFPDNLVAHLCRWPGETVRPYVKELCSFCSSHQNKSKNLNLIDALNYAAIIARNS